MREVRIDKLTTLNTRLKRSIFRQYFYGFFKSIQVISSMTASLRFEGVLNMDLMEFQVKFTDISDDRQSDTPD